MPDFSDFVFLNSEIQGFSYFGSEKPGISEVRKTGFSKPKSEKLGIFHQNNLVFLNNLNHM